MTSRAVKAVALYCRNNCIYVNPLSQTTEGLWISVEPVLKIDDYVTDSEIGAAVRECIERSRTGVPHPTDWKSVSSPLLETADVKSWDEFERGASHVYIKLKNGELSMRPTKKLAGGGFAANPAAAVTVMSDDPWSDRDVGVSARKALLDSQDQRGL